MSLLNQATEKKNMLITAKRKGKEVTLNVEFEAYTDDGRGWVKKEGGKKLYGTTGHYQPESKTIVTMRGVVLLTDVEGMK